MTSRLHVGRAEGGPHDASTLRSDRAQLAQVQEQAIRIDAWHGEVFYERQICMTVWARLWNILRL